MNASRMTVWGVAMALGLLVRLGYAAEGAEERRTFNIPAQSLEQALTKFGAASGLQVLFDSKIAADVKAPAVVGELQAEDALKKLLEGTELRYEFINARTVAIRAVKRGARDDEQPVADASIGTGLLRMAQAEGAGAVEGEQQAAPKEEGEKEGGVQLEEVVVTGTNIRGVYPASSPLSIYTAEDISKTGVSSIDQFVAKLPQNLNDLTSLGTGAFGNTNGHNEDSVNGVDLRGLGVGTTLVLLNGRRLAPSSNARTPDVSLIPLGLIDRVEMLTDGASAIYGADAVGGVVNFVLRDHIEGAHTTLAYGSVTNGGLHEIRAEQSVGREWESGHGLLAYTYFDRSDLDAEDRTFSAAAAPYTLSPRDRRHNVLATFEQTILEEIVVFGDALASWRDTLSSQLLHAANPPNTFQRLDNDIQQYFFNLGARKRLFSSIDGELLASYSNHHGLTQFRDTLPDDTVDRHSSGDSSATFDITAKIDGDLLQVAAGEVKFSAGGGHSHDRFRSRTFTGLKAPFSRDTNYIFSELLAPLFSSKNALPGLLGLELSLAARYTDYSDFGNKISPKVGLLWRPVAALKVRGTYGKSFRAPFLSQVDPADTSFGIFGLAPFGFPDIWSNDNSSTLLFVQGSGNPNLKPEEAKTYTAGLDFEPERFVGLRANLTYFNVEYTDRIAVGDSTGGFGAVFAPENFPDLFSTDPSTGQVADLITGAENFFNGTTVDPNDPAAVAGIVNVVLDNRVRNLASSKLDGLDFAVRYQLPTALGDIGLGTQATYLLNYTEQTTSRAPVLPRVNQVLSPVDLKLRGYINLTRGSLSGQLNVNYVDNYVNVYDVEPAKVTSWTTLDAAIAYDFNSPNGFHLSAIVQNILNKDPPHVSLSPVVGQGLIEPVGFDPANASPIGRFIALQISRDW